MGGAFQLDSQTLRRRSTLIRAALTAGMALAAMGARGQPAGQASAPVGRAYELIAEVNGLRASHGLAAYEPDPILMSVAQAQNDWRVAAGVTTHTGPDGSRPRDRAIAAGYGGGATVFISENIADGLGLTPAEAVQWWTGDAPHLNTMIGANYVHVGAGAGEADGVWRYTLMAGYVAGGAYTPGDAPPAPRAATGPNPILITSAPQPDGSVVHVVGPGQTLWTIAAIYGVELDDLMQLNGFSATPLLHAGDEILVLLAPTATATSEPTATAAPTSTRKPRTTPTAALPTATHTATPASAPSFDLAATPASRALVIIGGLLILGGALAGVLRREA